MIQRRVELVIAFQLARHDPHDAFNGVKRDGILLIGALHHQGPVEGNAEGQADLKVHTLPRHRVEGHAATQLAHFFVHHVHAHAAPGNLGDFFCGGKPRLQDELQHLAVANAV